MRHIRIHTGEREAKKEGTAYSHIIQDAVTELSCIFLKNSQCFLRCSWHQIVLCVQVIDLSTFVYAALDSGSVLHPKQMVLQILFFQWPLNFRQYQITKSHDCVFNQGRLWLVLPYWLHDKIPPTPKPFFSGFSENTKEVAVTICYLKFSIVGWASLGSTKMDSSFHPHVVYSSASC